MHWKICESCGEQMHGIRDEKEPIRRVCRPCGGNTLVDEDNPARIDARRTLAMIYGAMKNPPPFGAGL